MRYRRLKIQEFEALEAQFIQFLAVNSVTGSDWEKIKLQNPQRMNDLLDQFSDVVLSSVIDKVKYLVQIGKNSLMIFNCHTEYLEIVGINTDIEAKFDQYKRLADALEALPNNVKLQTFSHTKTYLKSRDMEIFELLESGCQITDEAIFNQISALNQTN